MDAIEISQDSAVQGRRCQRTARRPRKAGAEKMIISGGLAGLEGFVRELYGEARLAPFLGSLLSHSCDLLDSVAGSIFMLHPDRAHYVKVAERGPARATCQLGQSFSIDGGAAGLILKMRCPVTFPRYGDIRGGHLPVGHPVGRGSVVGVPIWWRGDVVGANIIFAGQHRQYSAAEIDGLEAITQIAAAGIVHAAATDPVFTNPSLRHQFVPSEESAWSYPSASRNLTTRELEVLGLAARGYTDKQIAAILSISPRTVGRHVGAILEKTGAPNRTRAVAIALEHGFLPQA
jgi:DNA-binding CsgD family transcriptional regulator